MQSVNQKKEKVLREKNQNTMHIDFNKLQKTLELQKQMLQDQDRLHTYQTQIYKQLQTTKRKSVQIQSDRIDQDLLILARVYRQRRLLKNCFSQMKCKNNFWKLKLYKAFMQQLKKKLLIRQFKKSLNF
ncbi:hypothetical protein pb186bvf_001401 [Paramecium bursaria]